MGHRQCDKCSELVDEARAFCPACGHAFVEEEKRQTKTEFESVDHTMQMGQTMYNQMLSDMGLNISKQQPKASPEKLAEVIAPVAPAAPVEPGQPPKTTNYLKWIIIIGACVLLLAFLVIIAAGVLLYWLSARA
jgi:hypothetical protein